jgi:hypothetical protein
MFRQAGLARGLLMQTGDIAHFAQRPEGAASGLRRGSAPSANSMFAMMQ